MIYTLTITYSIYNAQYKMYIVWMRHKLHIMPRFKQVLISADGYISQRQL